MGGAWTGEDILQLGRAYQSASVLTAAAELDLFTVLAAGPLSTEATASKLKADLRGTRILLDALVALELLHKSRDRYSLAPRISELLTADRPGSVLAMVRHQGNCLRRWAQLAAVVQSGRPAQRQASIRGEVADEAAFIEAMHEISAPAAATLFQEIGPLDFKHVLDIGGGSGTWLIPLLKSNPQATGTLFDLPQVLPLAERRLARAGLSDRVEVVGGDFLADPLPGGADLALVSAIVHQNSREQNRSLFRAVFAALLPGGQVLIRDVLMDDSRTRPPRGALFAVNMLVPDFPDGAFAMA